MKIAILSFYSGINNRGAETWAEEVKNNLNSEVEIFTKFWDSLKYWTNFDVVIPTNGHWQVFLCRLVTWVKGKPMVVFGHSGLGADDKWNLLCSPDVFVAFSTYQKQWAEKFKLPWTKVVMIPHAVDIKRFTPAKTKPKRSPLSGGKNIILFVGANTPSKRIELVKEAVEFIPDAEFLAVGKGNPIETSFNKMPEIYKKADVFCFVPHPWEAFGLVFLEAMASNLPVVTTDDPIRREIVADAGIFVDSPKNPKELSEAIRKALKINWSDKPRGQAENFSWDKIRIKYEELFKSLI
ncbi:MAG: glycosyltransferase family 4 protein [Patescibacteria group bacterium]